MRRDWWDERADPRIRPDDAEDFESGPLDIRFSWRGLVEAIGLALAIALMLAGCILVSAV